MGSMSNKKLSSCLRALTGMSLEIKNLQILTLSAKKISLSSKDRPSIWINFGVSRIRKIV